ncbi:VWA domain-containing protein [bacterium]|nr:VWA domain-containing protein [bacterium]
MKAVVWNLMLAAVVALTGAGEAAAKGPRLGLDVSPANGVLKAGKKQTTFVRVGLDGFKLERKQERSPVNLAIVLDKSGSMQGHKIEQARKAAIDAIGLLGPNDIVSVVTYDSTVSVLVPATKLTEPASVIAKIQSIRPGGNTALFAGVSKGAAEVRKFLDREHVNRVILLSDGLANEGPSSPGELAALGASLLKENISVTTLGLGLGYNEDLMTQLALQSGGNHHFVEDATQLVAVFRSEFDDVLSVVAQEVDVKITIPEGIRPVRVLGNEADINGQKIVTRIAQIYSEQDRYLVLELEIPESLANNNIDTSKLLYMQPRLEANDAARHGQRQLVTVEVSYTNLKTKATDHLQATASVSFSDDDEAVAQSVNRDVMTDVVSLISSEQNKLATSYLDAGNFAACRATLQKNADFLATNADAYKCPDLKLLEVQNLEQLKRLEGVNSLSAPAANAARKGMRFYQNSVDLQQKAVPAPSLQPAAKTPSESGAAQSGSASVKR